MLNQIKALLKDEQLRQKIKEANTQDEVIKLLTIAATEKGNNFTTEEATQILTKFALQKLYELNEEYLLAVAGRSTLPCYRPPITMW